MLRGRRPGAREGGAPRHLDLEPLDLLPRLGETLLQVASAGGGLERGDQVAQAGQLVPEELLVALGGIGAKGGEAAEIRLPVEGVLDGVAGRVVLGGQPGAPPLDGGREEGQPPAMMGAELIQRAREPLEEGHGHGRAQSLPCQTARRYRLVASSTRPASIDPGPP